MERNQHMEEISDKIRSGTPVGILEAIAAINYQSERRAYAAKNVWWRRLLRFLGATP